MTSEKAEGFLLSTVKGAALVDFNLEWVEPTLESGRIELGHFVLIPSSGPKEGVQ